MISFRKKIVDSTDSVSDKYLNINNFGYYEDLEDMHIYRKHGRLDYQLIYVKSGEIIIRDENEERILFGGYICLFSPGEPQIYQINGIKTSFYWIHFSGTEAGRFLSFFRDRIYYVGTFAEFEHYCRTGLNECYVESEFSELLYEGGLISLIARIGERISGGVKNERERRILAPALAAMHSEGGALLSNEELASLCGINKYYFIKTFKAVMGVTPQRYCAEIIVDKAKYLLSNTLYNINEISWRLGIEDSLYFSRMFKKHTGKSPREYRNNN